MYLIIKLCLPYLSDISLFCFPLQGNGIVDEILQNRTDDLAVPRSLKQLQPSEDPFTRVPDWQTELTGLKRSQQTGSLVRATEVVKSWAAKIGQAFRPAVAELEEPVAGSIVEASGASDSTDAIYPLADRSTSASNFPGERAGEPHSILQVGHDGSEQSLPSRNGEQALGRQDQHESQQQILSRPENAIKSLPRRPITHTRRRDIRTLITPLLRRLSPTTSNIAPNRRGATAARLPETSKYTKELAKYYAYEATPAGTLPRQFNGTMVRFFEHKVTSPLLFAFAVSHPPHAHTTPRHKYKHTHACLHRGLVCNYFSDIYLPRRFLAMFSLSAAQSRTAPAFFTAV